MNDRILETRPTLTLGRQAFDRPFQVDMERFFEFSFSLAEDLLDLEAAYSSETALADREIVLSHKPASCAKPAKYANAAELDFDIDASWM